MFFRKTVKPISGGRRLTEVKHGLIYYLFIIRGIIRAYICLVKNRQKRPAPGGHPIIDSNFAHVRNIIQSGF